MTKFCNFYLCHVLWKSFSSSATKEKRFAMARPGGGGGWGGRAIEADEMSITNLSSMGELWCQHWSSFWYNLNALIWTIRNGAAIGIARQNVGVVTSFLTYGSSACVWVHPKRESLLKHINRHLARQIMLDR